jgi:protein-L-isoaspartate(D-aspartate) O-methyltransferase
VPREVFIPQDRRSLAYSDKPITLGEGPGRTMLTPMVLARMIQHADVRPGNRVLTVGGGTGYAAAILAELGANVVALESRPEFDGQAHTGSGVAAGRIQAVTGPLADGHADAAPYDVILVEGSVQRAPDRLLAQLADGGRLVCIDGRSRPGRVTIYVRSGDHVGNRSVFDANAPILEGFEQMEAFVF